METEQQKQLTPEQARVIACLMEKHLVTPNNYPLSINSLMLACNQKSNREPIMQLTEGKIRHIVNDLEEQAYVRVDLGDRTDKVSHKGPGKFTITREEQAVLAMLMLRAPLTLSDIKARTEKMVGFESVDAVKVVVDSLMQRDQPLVVLIPKGTGQREDRYTHLLCGEPDLEQIQTAAASSTTSKSGKMELLEARIEALEARIRALENQQP